jgi:hypothetical protein
MTAHAAFRAVAYCFREMRDARRFQRRRRVHAAFEGANHVPTRPYFASTAEKNGGDA